MDMEVLDKQKRTRAMTDAFKPGPSRHEMPNHFSYHGDISGEEAEQRLRQSGKTNCYLTRYSRSNNGYMLSILTPNIEKIFHVKLEIDNKKPSYAISGAEEERQSLDELIAHYEINPMSPEIRSIGVPCMSGELLDEVKLSPQPSSMTSFSSTLDTKIESVQFHDMLQQQRKQLSDQHKRQMEEQEKANKEIMDSVRLQQRSQRKCTIL